MRAFGGTLTTARLIRLRYTLNTSGTNWTRTDFYGNEAINSNWSVRELKRQIDSSLFERLLLSDGNANKQKVLEMSKKGLVISKPVDIIFADCFQ